MSAPLYSSTKTYGHELGFSCAFRQWRAHSHCRFLHGYALSFKFVFIADKLDDFNWVVDFGGMKSLKGILERTFDHTTLVAEDDPEIVIFQKLAEHNMIQLRVLPNVGCECFAEYVYDVAAIWLQDAGYDGRVRLLSVEVAEHGANSAVYSEDVTDGC